MNGFAVFALVLATASALDIGDGSTWCEIEGTIGQSYANPFDRTEYYYCKALGTGLLTKCPPGTGFVRNNEVVGCVNWREWNCTYKGSDLGINCCTSSNTRCSDQNPEVYWQCQDGSSTPVNCPDGMGFFDYNGVASCLFWDQWFNVCEEIQGSL
ncbi:hypothetical protein ACFFRR_006080 [Megaselia abdita]